MQIPATKRPQNIERGFARRVKQLRGLAGVDADAGAAARNREREPPSPTKTGMLRCRSLATVFLADVGSSQRRDALRGREDALRSGGDDRSVPRPRRNPDKFETELPRLQETETLGHRGHARVTIPESSRKWNFYSYPDPTNPSRCTGYRFRFDTFDSSANFHVVGQVWVRSRRKEYFRDHGEEA